VSEDERAGDAAAEGTPEQRLLDTLLEYHQELGSPEVAQGDLLAGTTGDEDRLLAALERLERQGEVYRPAPDHIRATHPEG